jgi:hypothetical protein
LGGAAAIVCALAGCTAQPLGPVHDGGLPSLTGPLTQPQAGADGGTRSVAPGAGAGPVTGDPGSPPGTGSDGGAGAPPGPPVRLAPTTALGPADLLSAEVLAADGDGIYWLLADNQLWMLPAGSSSPRELASETTAWPAASIAYPGTLVAAGDALFWVSWVQAPNGDRREEIHRTKKSGGDDILVTNLLSDSVESVAVDDQYLYWTQDLAPWGGGGAQILALPRDAAPGTPPLLLATIDSPDEVFSLALDDRYLYWTACAALASKSYRATVWRADKSGLMNGTAVAAPFVDLAATFLWPYAGALYLEYVGATGTSSMGRADLAGGVGTLPIEPGSLAFLGDCVVSSTAIAGTSPQGGFIYAAPLVTGAAQVQIAADVAVPPVVGGPGLVFIDGTGQLVAISAADFRAALASGSP